MWTEMTFKNSFNPIRVFNEEMLMQNRIINREFRAKIHSQIKDLFFQMVPISENYENENILSLGTCIWRNEELRDRKLYDKCVCIYDIENKFEKIYL